MWILNNHNGQKLLIQGNDKLNDLKPYEKCKYLKDINSELFYNLNIKIKEGNMKNEPIVIISIMSYYANQIFNQTKKFEFRKSPLKKEDLNKKIYVYSAKDDKAIIGTFKVSKILKGTLSEILKATGYDVRSDKNEIINYYRSNNNCYALELYDVKKFKKPLTLKTLRIVDKDIKLPQYYDYIKASSPIYELIINHEKSQNT